MNERTTGEGAGPAPEETAENGDMFQAPPRRDNVSPFGPSSHGHPRAAGETARGSGGS